MTDSWRDKSDHSQDDVMETLPEAARHLRISPSTLRRMIKSGEGPRTLRPSPRRVVIPRSDRLAWMESRKVGKPAD